MAAKQASNFCARIVIIYIILLSVGKLTHGINLGLFAGDNKKHSNPLFIRRISRLSPVFININSGLPGLGKPSLSLPKLPPKPPPLRLPEPKIPRLKKTLRRKVPRSLLAPMLIPPIIPKLPRLPILPILPPLLPPLFPPLPFLPLPLLPPILPIPKLPKPIRVPIIGKTALQKALGSELKPVVVPLDSNKKVLDKLLELKRKGSLTTAEYIRFRKLLLNK